MKSLNRDSWTALCAATLIAGLSGMALAGDAPPSAPAPKSSAPKAPETTSQKEARALLQSMCNYLSGLKSFSFHSRNGYEVVQKNGQKVEFGESRIGVVARPDRMRLEESESDGNRDLLVFDGKLITVVATEDNVYAQAAQPPTLDDALVYFTRDLKMRMPLALMLSTQLKAALPDMTTEIDYVEHSEINGKRVHHLAGRTDSIDYQLWVADDNKPLPLRIIVTYRKAQGMPQYRSDISDWNTNPQITAATFQFKLPAGAKQIPFAVQATSAGAPAPAATGEVKK